MNTQTTAFYSLGTLTNKKLDHIFCKFTIYKIQVPIADRAIKWSTIINSL